eukprot:CAMPEP_0171409140 /NCGR_PEP_ID=MMETSP0880-20121228/23655_1 /TAXON_ID=67004 /ORGANISM="Thalassiosira weissflogii, Strain CCMP1336" /LENGTH=51 /DNA_ID=CAMNT_0011925557 /DNA_START=121 /DNA_END=272 /DNA_ORIENTATION=+
MNPQIGSSVSILSKMYSMLRGLLGQRDFFPRAISDKCFRLVASLQRRANSA